MSANNSGGFSPPGLPKDKKKRRIDNGTVLPQSTGSELEVVSELPPEVDLLAQEQAPRSITEVKQTEMHDAMVDAAKEAGVIPVVDAQIHTGSVKNHEDKIAFTTSIVPDQKSKVKHKGLRAESVQTPAEQTRISIKVFPDKLDTGTTKALEATVKDHKFNIKAKSAVAILNFIKKCENSSVITTLAFDEKVLPPGVKFTNAEIQEIKSKLAQAQEKYLEAHPADPHAPPKHGPTATTGSV